jgi:hypothetical protein
MTFKKNKYQIIRQAISLELADFCFNYLLLKRDAIKFLYEKNVIAPHSIHGHWNDPQCPNVYSIYGDPVMETLLMKVGFLMKDKTTLNLVPTYSYARMYEKGSILEKHKDRPSCEISTTLNLGGDPWPIFIEEKKIDLKPGDMVIYAGCELEHWRNTFEGNLCGQVFLHYNHAEGKFAKSNLYDKRPMLGVPKTP